MSEFQPGYLQDLLAAQQAKADADVALKSSQEALDQFQPGYGQELVEARQDTANAEIDLQAAQNSLDQYEAANWRTLGQAREDKNQAQTLLEIALHELAKLLSQRESGATNIKISVFRIFWLAGLGVGDHLFYLYI